MHPQSVRVPVADLRSAVNLLLNEAERKFGPTIDLVDDYYWLLELDQAHETDPPVVSSKGSLADDAESIRELLDGDPEEGVYLWHDLAHLVGVLRQIADLDQRRFAN